ncbi:hypothetical protein [Kordiimonas aquimaris]|uniref:hypothetical protein n=1 Tax=Kordiimonas aquimaris TaxID=707591 RepID=UPI0021CE7618|nr:hypothetical protein [Kordiimonas aquimaris]
MVNIIKPNIRELSNKELTFVAGGFSFTEHQVSENIDAIISNGLTEEMQSTACAISAVSLRHSSSEAFVDALGEATPENVALDSQPDVGLPSIAAFLDEFSVRPFNLNPDGRL